MPDDDQNNRLYALHLLKQVAGSAFDHRDVAVLARIVPLVEANVADLLKRYADEIDTFHSVAGGFVRGAADLIVEGKHRPELPQPLPEAAALESNAKFQGTGND